MPDYKSMYYHLAGRMATAIDVLEAATDMLTANAEALTANAEALTEIKEKLKFAQQTTEEMFMACEEEIPDKIEKTKN